jgi:hypothetical protein
MFFGQQVCVRWYVSVNSVFVHELCVYLCVYVCFFENIF